MMPRGNPSRRKRTTNRGWDMNDMKMAVDQVLSGTMTIRESAECYNVKKSTLHEKVAAMKKNHEVSLMPKLGRFSDTFTPKEENDLIEYMLYMDNNLMGLNKKEFLRLAFDFAEKLNLNHRFNKEKGMAGNDFYQGFMYRHPELTLRIPQNTSNARRMGFNKEAVQKFFDNLESLYSKYSLEPSRIYNCDETGITHVHSNGKVITLLGKSTVAKATSGERGLHATVEMCANACGDLIPPFFIFKAPKNKKEELLQGAPENSDCFIGKSSWITTDVFMLWLNHFIKFARPTVEKPVVLILDGHSSHKHLKVINLAQENGVILLTLPPHCTHKMQVMDLTVFKSFKCAFNSAAEKLFREQHNITYYDVAQLTAEALKSIRIGELAISGFKNIGIYPLNRDVFQFKEDSPVKETSTNENRKILETLLPLSKKKITKRTSKKAESQILTELDQNLEINRISMDTRANQTSSRRKSRKNKGANEEDLSFDIAEVQLALDADNPLTGTRSTKNENDILNNENISLEMEENWITTNTDQSRNIRSGKNKHVSNEEDVSFDMNEIYLALDADELSTRASSNKNNDTDILTERNLLLETHEIWGLAENKNCKESHGSCIICSETSTKADLIQCYLCTEYVHIKCTKNPQDMIYFLCDICTQ